MTRANWINPPSLEEGKGWWVFKLRQALEWVRLQTVCAALTYRLPATHTWTLFPKLKKEKFRAKVRKKDFSRKMNKSTKLSLSCRWRRIRTSLRIVQIVLPWKPEPGSGRKDHRRWTTCLDCILNTLLFSLHTGERYINHTLLFAITTL